MFPEVFAFSREDSSKKRCPFIEKTKTSRKKTNIFETCTCFLWHWFKELFLCTTPSKELKKHLQMQLKKWTLSKKKGKKKIAVNIWSTDSLFLYQVILEATNSTNTGKGRIQDSSENYTATVLLIFFFTYKVSFWMEFITFNKNFSKINLYSLY